MDVFRTVYVAAEETDYGQWIRRFWEEASPEDDPLRQLLEPEDLRGEVMAWGDYPHWTVLDAMTTFAADEFTEIVKSVCRLALSPTIRPEGLRIYGSSALVVKCVERGLDRIRAALVVASRHLIARSQLTDEEFQRAEWWIRRINNDVSGHLGSLRAARRQYLENGCPPLPNSRHFRLGFLVRLIKEIERANDGAVREAKRRHLRYFFSHGEPHWYAGSSSLHTTIASGLNVTDEANRQRQLDRFTNLLWPTVERELRSYQPRYLVIMGEDPENTKPVHFFDWLTETFVEEERPGFKEIGRAEFGQNREMQDDMA